MHINRAGAQIDRPCRRIQEPGILVEVLGDPCVRSIGSGERDDRIHRRGALDPCGEPLVGDIGPEFAHQPAGEVVDSDRAVDAPAHSFPAEPLTPLVDVQELIVVAAGEFQGECVLGELDGLDEGLALERVQGHGRAASQSSMPLYPFGTCTR